MPIPGHDFETESTVQDDGSYEGGELAIEEVVLGGNGSDSGNDSGSDSGSDSDNFGEAVET